MKNQLATPLDVSCGHEPVQRASLIAKAQLTIAEDGEVLQKLSK